MIDLWLGSFPGFRTVIIIAFFQINRKYPIRIQPLIKRSSKKIAFFGSSFKAKLLMESSQGILRFGSLIIIDLIIFWYLGIL